MPPAVQMKPFVVGIAGGTASGKTTAALRLAEKLGARASLLQHDRYYRSLPVGLHPLQWNFDHPDSLETARLVSDLDDLRAGRSAQIPHYDFPTHSRSVEVDVVQPTAIVLVEGILVLADPALRERFDLSVYVDAPDDLRLVRRIRRDLQKRGRSIDDVLDQWEATVAPMHRRFVAPSREHANLVLDGTIDPDVLVAQICVGLPEGA